MVGEGGWVIVLCGCDVRARRVGVEVVFAARKQRATMLPLPRRVVPTRVEPDTVDVHGSVGGPP